MTDAINTTNLNLSAEDIQGFTDAVKSFFEPVAHPLTDPTDLNLLLFGAESLLQKYRNTLEPFALSTGRYLVGNAGFVLGMGQFASAIGDLENGKPLSEVYWKLMGSAGSMVGSAGMMLQAYGGVVVGSAAVGSETALAGARLLALGTSLNTAGLLIAGGAIAGSNLPDDWTIAMAEAWDLFLYGYGIKTLPESSFIASNVESNVKWTLYDGTVSFVRNGEIPPNLWISKDMGGTVGNVSFGIPQDAQSLMVSRNPDGTLTYVLQRTGQTQTEAYIYAKNANNQYVPIRSITGSTDAAGVAHVTLTDQTTVINASYDTDTGKVDIINRTEAIKNAAGTITSATISGNGASFTATNATITINPGTTNVTINGDGNTLNLGNGVTNLTTTGSVTVTYGGKTQQIIGTNTISTNSQGAPTLVDSTGTTFVDANKDGLWDKSITAAGKTTILDGNLAAAQAANKTLGANQFFIGGAYDTLEKAAAVLNTEAWVLRVANLGKSDAQMIQEGVITQSTRFGSVYGIDNQHMNYDAARGITTFTNTPSASDLRNRESQLTSLSRQGLLDTNFFNSFTSATRTTHLSVGSSSIDWSQLFAPGSNFFSAIGAFYEAINPAADTAPSIADKTPVLLGADNLGITAAQLQSRDTNADSKLTGTELNGLNAWSDLNQNGLLESGELGTLAQANLTEIQNRDTTFYTIGNGQPLSGVAATPTVNISAPSINVPASNYRSLRDTDNQYVWVNGGIIQGINWTANQIKINYSNRSTMIGTDGNDAFDANSYSANGDIFNLSLLTNFLGGGGDDQVGGSTRSDNLWGGTGNDLLAGFAGDDNLYGEEGYDELQGGEGSDTLAGGGDNDVLFGGSGVDTLLGGDGHDQLQGGDGNDRLNGELGNDRVFGQVGDDQLWGGDGDDILAGFTAVNESKQTLNAGESDNDTLIGGAGNDLIIGNIGNDILDGGSGKDELAGDDGNDQLTGGSDDDKMFGGAGDDRVANDEVWEQVA